MGMVKVDIYKKERQFELISFTDVDCIKGLIKFRSIVDGFRGTQHNISTEVAQHFEAASDAIGGVNPEIIAIYVSLDSLLVKCELNSKQRYIVEKLMDGYTEQDLAEEFHTEPKTIASTLSTIVNRVKKINDLDWKYEYVYMNVAKAEFGYKTCTRCTTSKPATDDFFGKDNRNKDGFKSHCRKCHAIKGKTTDAT